MADQDRLRSLLESSHPCIFIPTDEEEYAMRMVRDAAMSLGCPVRQWDVVRGISDGLLYPSPNKPEDGTEHPAAALYRFAGYTEPTICVMLDLIGHLADERTLRAARDAIGAFDRAQESGWGAQAGQGPARGNQLSGGRLVIIDHRDGLPPVLQSCAARLELAAPDETEIEAIVVATLRRVHRLRPIEIGISKRDLAMIVANLRGISRRQIEQVVIEAVWDDRKFSPADLPAILARKREMVCEGGLLEFVQAPTDMNQIGGLGRLKQWLKEREGSMSEEGAAFGLEPPRGLLMLGVQGAGKSLCAKAIATAWRRPLMKLDPSVLFDRYIGESERRLREALKQAESMAPVVLWIDEIEKGFASAASHSIDGGLSQRMFGTLLTWMQEHKAAVFLAATANNIEALPPELLRKGRFDEIFFVDLPGEAARKQIFQIHIKKRGRDPKAFDTQALAAASEGYSGAEIEQAVVAALHVAFSAKGKLDTQMIATALAGSPPLSVTMAERINRLRAWAAGRCVPAE